MEDLKEIVRLVYQALEEKKAEDITIIDISNISVISDYFIVASGSNQNQLLAMQDEVDHVLHEHGIDVKQIVTHEFTLDESEKAFQTVVEDAQNVVKGIIRM